MSSIPLACPECRGRGLERQGSGGLLCRNCTTSYPRRADVDVFLTGPQWQGVVERAEEERGVIDLYRRARRESLLNVQYYDAWVKRLWGLVPSHCRGLVVELMCGEAEIGRRLPQDVEACLGIDLNARLVEEAARHLAQQGEQRVQVVCGSADRLPLPDHSAGAVLIQGGLHHARPLLTDILAEVARVLKPGGVLVASEPANDAWLIRWIRHWQYKRSALQGKDPDEDGFTRQEMAGALKEHGLKLELYRPFGYLAYPLMGNTDLLPLLARSRSRLLGRLLLGIDRTLEFIPILRRLGWASLFRATRVAPAVSLPARRQVS